MARPGSSTSSRAIELQRSVEKARLLLEELASEEHVARFARLQDDYERVGGYRGEAEARAIVAGLGLAQDRLHLPARPEASGGGWSWPGSSSAARTYCCWTSPRTTSTRTRRDG